MVETGGIWGKTHGDSRVALSNFEQLTSKGWARSNTQVPSNHLRVARNNAASDYTDVERAKPGSVMNNVDNISTPVRGLGIDLVSIETIHGALRRDVNAAYSWLTNAEVEALGERVSSAETLAGRVAAKEAIVKSLGCGFDAEVTWQDVTISVDNAGALVVNLSGGAEIIAESLNVRQILVSITHAGEYAAASACALT